MAYVVSILNCVTHLSLSWHTPHEAAYGFTPDAVHLMKFELWDAILILDDKNQFTNSLEVFGYYSGPDLNKVPPVISWVWNEEHDLLECSVLSHATIPADPNHQMVPVSGEIK